MEDRRKKDDCTTTSCLFPFVIQPNVIVCVQLYCDAAALCIVYLLSHQLNKFSSTLILLSTAMPQVLPWCLVLSYPGCPPRISR